MWRSRLDIVHYVTMKHMLAVMLLAFIPHVVHAAGTPNYCDGPRTGVIGYRGTITVHSGIPRPCVVNILGGATLTAGGGTAPQIPGKSTRAVFRVTGRGLDDPGGVTIVVGASTDSGNAPEVDNLNRPATLDLAHGTVLVRYDFARNKYVAVPDGRIQQALVAYKIVRRGASAFVQPALQATPAELPATGGPLRIAPLFAWVLLLLYHSRSRAGARAPAVGSRRGLVLLVAGSVVLALALMGSIYMLGERNTSAVGFGSIAASQGISPRLSGASNPPSRIVIPRIGVDTRTTMLDVVGGAWQVPSYGAGYLVGSALPGQVGNEAITGHDDTDGSVFRRLGDLHAGDEVRVYAGAQVYRYRVLALRVVPPPRTDVIRPTRGATLTLITCTPYLVDTDRLVVRAELRT
jgi:LPXTG-site transpeptidase (sortase) family protein